MVSRSVAVSIVLAATLLAAGCLSAGPGEATQNGSTPTTDTTTVATTTETETTTDTETVSSWVHASNQPDASKSVSLENRWTENVTMDVRVLRNATGETVHEGTYELAPGGDREVYDTADADPDGIETFTVVVSARNTTQSVAIETNECHGGAYGSVSDGGELQTTYAIC